MTRKRKHTWTRGWGCVFRSPRVVLMPPFLWGHRPGGRGWEPKPPSDPYAKVAELAKLTCESPPFGTPSPDAELLKALKREVRHDDNAMERVLDVLLHALTQKECGPRMHAVCVIDQLFHRSAKFRTMALEHLDLFLQRAVGVDLDSNPLPGPPGETRQLIDRSVAALESWADKFGVYHPRLPLSVRFATDALGEEAPAVRARAIARENRELLKRENALLVTRWRRVEQGLLLVVADATEHIAGMKSAVELLLGAGDAQALETNEGEWEDVDDEKDIAKETYFWSSVPTHVPEVSHETSTISVTETKENAKVLYKLRVACHAATTRSVPGLTAAMSLLAKIAPEEEIGDPGVSAAFRVSTLKDLATVKRELTQWLMRCKSIGIEEAGVVDNGIEDDVGDGTQHSTGDSATQLHSESMADGDGGLVVTVPRLVGAPREDEPPVEGDSATLDALLERARRRRGRQNSASNQQRPRDPSMPFWMGRRSTSRAAKPGGMESTPGSVTQRTHRIFASREATEHNNSVMRELGESGVERREGVSGFTEKQRRKREANMTEDAARALAETEAREAKRKRNEPTAKQRIEQKLKQMKKGKRQR